MTKKFVPVIVRFDEEGKLILSTMLVDEDGNLTYYKDGKLTANAGLIEYDEAYYYIGENGIAVTNEKVDVPENDLGVAPGIHCFGNDGKMFERLAGDADDNGVINIYDALNIIKYISNQTENINYLNADVNEDNKVDIYDALNIMKNGAGWAVELK